MALALMLWSAGAGCMMVSYARAAAVESSDTAGVMDHAAAGSMSIDAHACCKAKRSSSQTHHARSQRSSSLLEFNLATAPTTPPQSGSMSCCPLTSGSIVVTSRSQSNERDTVLQDTDSSALLLVKSNPAPLAIPLRLPNRARSYLLDCAFLI